MFLTLKIKKKTLALLLIITLVLAAAAGHVWAATTQNSFIKWVDFDVPASLLRQALDADISAHEAGGRLDWWELLAYLAAKYGGDFSLYKQADLDQALERLEAGEGLAAQAEKLPHFDYYKEAYQAVLGGLVGEYQREGDEGWETFYGLRGYSPIAETFPYNDYDDFGVSREYGYHRRHLGHDMMAAVGTPVIAVESGVVEALGWNQYGGWRVGIRSFDGLRYHYYAHLRKDRPFAEGLAVGQTVMAGDVIGYVGRTGYSAKENVNGIEQSHLHYGLQLIFDESQKEGNGEIWVDVYALCQLLRGRQSEVERNDETKEWTRARGYREEVATDDRFG